MAICRCWRNRFIFLLPLIFFILPLLLSVSELYRKPIQQGKKDTFPKKSDHLVLGPVSGEGLPNRLQCDGLNALNKTSFPGSQTILEAMEYVSFVTMFTVHNNSLRPELERINDRIDSKVIIESTSYTKAERSIAILNTFVDFIQISMPRSCIFLLTDPTAQFTIYRKKVSQFPIFGDYSRGQLMLQRIRSYIAFLESRLKQKPETQCFSSHYIFTDSDVAIVGDLGHLFRNHPNFHLALTFRNNKDQPLNSGFIAVRGTLEAIHKSKIFLEEVMKVYTSKYMSASRMLGDQLAFAWVVRSCLSFAAERFRKPEAFSGEINGVSILFLPCTIYNWTPPEGAGQFHGMPLDVQVVHFKGSRKRLMLEAWNYYKRTSNLPDMLCLVLRSGRTKYDF